MDYQTISHTFSTMFYLKLYTFVVQHFVLNFIRSHFKRSIKILKSFKLKYVCIKSYKIESIKIRQATQNKKINKTTNLIGNY